MASKTTKGRKNTRSKKKTRTKAKSSNAKNTELAGGNYDTCYIDSVHSACFE